MGKLPRDLFEDELVPLCEKVTEERLPPCFSRLFLTLLSPSSVWSNLRGEDDDGLQREQPRLRLRHLQQQTGGQSSDEAAQQLRDQVTQEPDRNEEEDFLVFLTPEMVPLWKHMTEHSRFTSAETDASSESAPASTTAACLWVGFPKPKSGRRSCAR